MSTEIDQEVRDFLLEAFSNEVVEEKPTKKELQNAKTKAAKQNWKSMVVFCQLFHSNKKDENLV